MVGQGRGFQTSPYPNQRRLAIDAGAWSHGKNIIHALVEFDVTKARELMRARAEVAGTRLSFTAFVVACIGRAVATDRMWHAYRKGRRLILFDDVDVAVLVEREIEGQKLATFYVVRKANEKAVDEISEEIRRGQHEKVEAIPGAGWWKLYLALPGPFRRLLHWCLDRSPQIRKRLGGTVIVTAVGMFGDGGGWGIPLASNTLTVTVGGIATKPGVVEGRIEPREYLGVTISFDHDIIDGAPAARFCNKLREIVESAALLE